MRDAYVGAREDLATWKRRALEAEAKLREAASTNRLTVTPAMVKAAMPWLANLHHMRKTDKESNVEEAIRAVFAIIAATEGK